MPNAVVQQAWDPLPTAVTLDRRSGRPAVLGEHQPLGRERLLTVLGRAAGRSANRSTLAGRPVDVGAGRHDPHHVGVGDLGQRRRRSTRGAGVWNGSPPLKSCRTMTFRPSAEASAASHVGRVGTPCSSRRRTAWRSGRAPAPGRSSRPSSRSTYSNWGSSVATAWDQRICRAP